MEDYSQLLKGRNVAQIINTIQEEIQRRREIHSLKSVNRKIIKSKVNNKSHFSILVLLKLD